MLTYGIPNLCPMPSLYPSYPCSPCSGGHNYYDSMCGGYGYDSYYRGAMSSMVGGQVGMALGSLAGLCVGGFWGVLPGSMLGYTLGSFAGWLFGSRPRPCHSYYC
jgi:hypothetical protein